MPTSFMVRVLIENEGDQCSGCRFADGEGQFYCSLFDRVLKQSSLNDFFRCDECKDATEGE